MLKIKNNNRFDDVMKKFVTVVDFCNFRAKKPKFQPIWSRI